MCHPLYPDIPGENHRICDLSPGKVLAWRAGDLQLQLGAERSCFGGHDVIDGCCLKLFVDLGWSWCLQIKTMAVHISPWLAKVLLHLPFIESKLLLLPGFHRLSSFWGAIMLHFMVVYMYSYTIIDSVYKMPGRWSTISRIRSKWNIAKLFRSRWKVGNQEWYVPWLYIPMVVGVLFFQQF